VCGAFHNASLSLSENRKKHCSLKKCQTSVPSKAQEGKGKGKGKGKAFRYRPEQILGVSGG
jgi:hypothetical protein